MGTYPSPKACSSLVVYEDCLLLFGGWTHPSPYPLHQSWKLFNELHIFHVAEKR
jgi:F-box protein 42